MLYYPQLVLLSVFQWTYTVQCTVHIELCMLIANYLELDSIGCRVERIDDNLESGEVADKQVL